MIVEHGYGVHNADAYVPTSYVDSYALARGISSWAALAEDDKEIAIIKATDYIENRFGMRFRGYKAYPSVISSRNVLKFTQNPSAGETITIGTDTLEFGIDVLVSPLLAITIDNLINVVNAEFVDIDAEPGYGSEVVFTSAYYGVDAEAVDTTTDVVGGSWHFSNFQGGDAYGLAQSLSFPRAALYTVDGYALLGIPEGIKKATSEYAIRASIAELMPDPTVETNGLTIKRKLEKLGPIEEETEYFAGVQTVKPFPAADLLLKPFLGFYGGGTIR